MTIAIQSYPVIAVIAALAYYSFILHQYASVFKLWLFS